MLQDFNLTLSPGEIVFLTGPNGSGKSTALRAIANLDARDAGILQLEGRTPSQVGFAEWRRDVMYVPQYRLTHNGTARDLFVQAVKLSSRAFLGEDYEQRSEKYIQLCVAVGLERSDVTQQRWNELSGGTPAWDLIS